MSDDTDQPHTGSNKHRQWVANPSEQWAFALDHMDIEEYELAIRHCERAIEIWPTYYDAWLLLSGAHEASGDLDSALDAAQQTSEIAVYQLSQAWNNLAALHLIRGEYEEALTIDRVLDLVDPTRHPITNYRMAVAYTALGDLESGERWLREAIYHREDLLERAQYEPLLEAHSDWLGILRIQKEQSTK